MILLFWLINLEIFDYFAAGRYIQLDEALDDTRRLWRNLTFSAAWAVYAVALLSSASGAGRRACASPRWASCCCRRKVFLFDLSKLEGLYRILSFLGLGMSLILVSLLYQRFVRRSDS